jgi:hypothetical protein
VKDAMSREIIGNLKAAGLGIASGTYQIVGVPKLEVAISGGDTPQERAAAAANAPQAAPPAT